MSVKVNWTKAGIIGVTTTLGTLAGKLVELAGMPYGTVIGAAIGLIVGAAVEVESQIIADTPASA